MRPRELITTHTNADFDALGSALAARRLYPGAAIRLPGGVNRNVRAFISLHADELDIPDPARIELGAVERVIVVDAAQPDRLADMVELIERPAVEVLVFDHHAHGHRLPGRRIAGDLR